MRVGHQKAVTKEETKPNPYGKRAVLKMLIKSVAERERSKAGVTKEDVNELPQGETIRKPINVGSKYTPTRALEDNSSTLPRY